MEETNRSRDLGLEFLCGPNSLWWDHQLTWNTKDPIFTSCFVKTTCIYIPILFFWLFLPFELLLLWRSKARSIPFSILSWCKIIATSGNILMSTIDLLNLIVISVSSSSSITPLYPVDFIDPLLRLLTFSFIFLLHFLERARGLRTSGLQWTFFFVYGLLSIVNLYGYIRLSVTFNDLTFITFLIHLILLFLNLLTHFFVEKSPTYRNASCNEQESREPCPIESSSFPSKLVFGWLDPLIWIGYKRPLASEDLFNLPPSLVSKVVVPKLNQRILRALGKSKDLSTKWDILNSNGIGKETEVKTIFPKGLHTNINIFPILVQVYGFLVFKGAIYKMLNDLLTFAPPILLKYIIDYAENKDMELWKGVLYAFLMLISTTLTSIFISKFFYLMYVVGILIKSGLTSAIYRKALKVSNSAKQDSTTGEIVNLMSVDIQKLVDLMPYINLVWSGPLQIIVAISLLWQTLGPSVMAGLGVMILLIPINGVIASKSRQLQIQQMKHKDERIKLMNEILQGIKILKLYGWEKAFDEMISSIRNEELMVLRKSAYFQSGSSFIWSCAPFLVSLVTFATYILIDENNRLDPQKAFVSLSLFNILRFPLSMLPMTISSAIQASVSIKRFNKFINAPELDEDAVTRSYEKDGEDKKNENEKDKNRRGSILIENGNFSWSLDPLSPSILSDITLKVLPGSLVAVVGTVGSGKSSLLSALLGEMNKNSGSVFVNGRVAYVAQQPWIQNTSLKKNILFSKAFDKGKYSKVLAATSLNSDLDNLPRGDATEIGEKGINLSGGQKARLSLARALYSNADIYLLDDPLSAVDSNVGKHIFDNVLHSQDGYLRGKTRIIVTHSATYLPFTDQILVLKEGRISEMGTYAELIEQKGAFSDFAGQFLFEGSESHQGDVTKETKASLEEKTSSKRIQRSRTLSSSSGGQSEETSSVSSSKKDMKDQYQDERAETGQVGLSVYLYYMEHMGVLNMILSLLGFIGYQILSTGSTIWLAWWADAVSNNSLPFSLETSASSLQHYYLGIYGLFGLGQALFIIIGSLCLSIACLEVSKTLHKNMLVNICRSAMAFFDTTPLGRILNRFGKDVDVLDTVMNMTFRGWLTCLLAVISSLLIVIYTTPIFLAPSSIVIVIYYAIQRVYVSASRQLKRLESISRSPIYSHFGETLTGAPTIRAYNLQDNHILESEKRVDDNLKASFPSMASNRWLSVRLECIGNLIVFSASLFAILDKSLLSPGMVGLSVSYAMTVTATMNWLVRMACEMEANIVSAERIKEYTVSPTEAAWDIEPKPDISWPDAGHIQIKNYSSRYREGLDLVIKDLNLDIKGGENIGIVGRTGAGKSSLTLSLFRIIEAAVGEIVIDGINISKIGLHQLRHKLTIIPQDPILFSGTLRMNLDPVSLYDDESLWLALEHSHLKNYVTTSLTNGLDHVVTEGGENFSVGQKQLICLARALLRKTKVLVLDEATASIDLETDDLIQATIRNQFKESTVITIAHRLNTIIDYDKILVLSGGTQKEFDSPSNLLSNTNSHFYSMCKDAGLV